MLNVTLNVIRVHLGPTNYTKMADDWSSERNKCKRDVFNSFKKQTFWNKMEAWRLERQRITHLVAQGFGFNLRENGQKSDAISQVHVHTRQRNQGLKEASTGQWLVAPPDHVMAPFGLSLVITSDFRRPDGKWRHQKRKWIMLKTCSTWTAF